MYLGTVASHPPAHTVLTLSLLMLSTAQGLPLPTVLSPPGGKNLLEKAVCSLFSSNAGCSNQDLPLAVL